jgi:formate dehydrogenase subunit gamma
MPQAITPSAQKKAQQKIEQIIAAKQHLSGALLPILHDIQDHFGYIPKTALPLIATALQQTEAEIYGVISFYAHFKLTPTGKYIVEICRGEACQAMGSKPLEQAIKQQLGCEYTETTQDNSITLEPVYCLGNCACAPSVKVDDKVYGRMTAEKFSHLSDQLSSYAISLDGVAEQPAKE